ncbi:hypothetical protein [Clostridium butyricum]|uniref:hypothetical protein n=1 Tax=Clostridium butyricum TaxID=1492 RepID=UPI002AAFF277|nr:hypothetical protein [Clostridium butyricum]
MQTSCKDTYKRRWMTINGEMVEIPMDAKIESNGGPVCTIYEPDITEEENERRWQAVQDVLRKIVRHNNQKKYEESMCKK